MESFPKKYNSKDLRNRSKLYKKNSENNHDNTIFSLNFLSSSKKLSYYDFFEIYLKDFFNKNSIINNLDNKHYQQLFIISWNRLDDLSANYLFFSKKNQNLIQIWTNKLRKRILSVSRKNINTNNKILDSYLSSQHKIFLPDSDLYIYVLNKLQTLRNNWKIKEITEIWYRSFNLQTTIPHQDILRKKEKIPQYTLRYFIEAKWDAIYVPIQWDIDACCWDVALLVHPKDKRYNKYIWKNVIIPLSNRLIPIIGDETVNIAENEWIKRVCPCSDEESITLAKKFWLPTDIYVFDKQWLYTQYIHEPAFVWEKRSKYYSNIVSFINDIWNVVNESEILADVPYIETINERLTPYKIDQLIINLEDEKEKIINNILKNNLIFPFIKSFEDRHNEYSQGLNNDSHYLNLNENSLQKEDTLQNDDELFAYKKYITNSIQNYLPNSLVLNRQTLHGWRLPLIKDDKWNITFFDIENEHIAWNDNLLQLCFNYILLSMIRAWTLWLTIKKENKLCEYNKLTYFFSENEKFIEYFINELSKITWNKPEYNKFLQIVENLNSENNTTTNDLLHLAKNSKFLHQEWNRLFLNIKWLLTNDIIDPEFIKLCIPAYLDSKNIKINNKIIYTKKDKNNLFKSLLIQELLIWHTLYNEFLEEEYKQEWEFLWDKQLSKSQTTQAQRDIFSLFWENPIRLSFLINKTFNQKEILLNNIFLKQVRNAIRLCIQKKFLPKDIKICLNNQPDHLDDFDIFLLCKLNEFLDDFINIKDYDEYITFFNKFKSSIEDIFFSRYIEIIKYKTTWNTQFVCAYFFNFLLNIIYPLVPEFTEALEYVSQKDFLNPIRHIDLNKTINYNTNLLYNTFLKIKELRIENNIKQHETCNIFIKSTPTICNIFAENEQMFKNYFHISEINYIRLHEQNPLWYEIFSNEELSIWIQLWDYQTLKNNNSSESLERDIKNLDDKLNLLRQRLQILPEWEERKKVEEEYAKTKEEMETLTIKHSLLSSK